MPETSQRLLAAAPFELPSCCGGIASTHPVVEGMLWADHATIVAAVGRGEDAPRRLVKGSTEGGGG